MINYNPFSGKGAFYKGCLHCHTTASDGGLPLEKVISIYKKLGYGFLAATDHHLFTDTIEFNDDNFILLPGIEYCMEKSNSLKTFHFLGLRESEDNSLNSMKHSETHKGPAWDGDDTDQRIPQSMIDFLREKNNHVILCHTVWSRTDPEDFKNLEGYFAMEVYNNISELKRHMGLSAIHWDSVLRTGKKVFGIASDDAHHKIKDQGGGWVMVKAESLTSKDIMDSLLAGRFYSSTGPEINRFEIIDSKVYIECSSVKSIHFTSDEPRGKSFRAGENDMIDNASYSIDGSEKYIRVECIDSQGKTAWTNPIFLETLNFKK